MVITFLVPTSRRPVGGIMAIYEFANALARLGHEVHLVHVNGGDETVRSATEITWCDLDVRLRHHFPPDHGVEHLPDADFISGFGADYPDRCGLPLLLVQGCGVLRKAVEDRIFAGPYPKLCTGRWLVDMCRGLGVSEAQAIHLPYGLKHEKYRLVSAVEDRPPRVAMVYNSHVVKACGHGLEALARVKRKVPEADMVVFGANEPVHDIPAGVEYRLSPPQTAIVEEIYNRSQVFLNSSNREGFGLPCIEAMACGCAIVTTDTGGSRDYALHGETALVVSPGDVTGLAAYIETLLENATKRVQLARAGMQFVKRYDWEESGRRLEAFLDVYASDPDRHQLAAQDWAAGEATQH